MAVGSMADSMGVYVPAKVIQKLLGLGRLLVFMYLVAGKTQFALWTLGVAIFSVAAPLLTLGSPNALARYAALYEQRGELRRFCRNALLIVLGCTAVTAAIAFAASDLITLYVMLSGKTAGPDVSFELQRTVCYVALGNAVMLTLYLNLTAILYGLRTYRLVAAVELLFAVLFTAAGTTVLLVWPTGLAVLAAHMVCLAAATLAGAAGLWLGLDKIADSQEQTQGRPAEAGRSAGSPERATTANMLGRLLRFGLVALAANTLWGMASYASLWLTNRHLSKSDAGVFSAMLLIGQPVLFLADAAWAVVFSHVARRWESHDRSGAMFTLEAAYKAVTLSLMTLAVGMYVTAPLWIRVLPAGYRSGLPLLGGLLLYFQTVIHLALLTIVAKLHERPWVIAVAAAAAIGGNLSLGLTWVPTWGMEGASWAAGVGCLGGSLAVSAIYLLGSRARLTAGSWIVLAVPALLLLPAWAAAAAWAGLLAAALTTRLVLTPREKTLLAGKIAAGWRRVRSWR